MAGLLLIEPKTTRQAFLGKPVEEVLAMVKWTLKHEGEAEFDSDRILLAWAKKTRPGLLEGRGPQGRGVPTMPRDRMGTGALQECG